jgi:glutaconate CoA-transferase subunit B
VDFTPDELMVVSMARQLEDGEVVVQGLATPLVASAYLLARRTHAPNLYFASAIGQGICRQPAPLGLLTVEHIWLDLSLNNPGFVRVIADVLPTMRPKEYFRPAQIDSNGNFNNIAFGKDYSRPRLRLPGTGGIPDVTTFLENICLYVPRHSRVTFVQSLDHRSGLGYHLKRKKGYGPRYLVSDLGQFDWQRNEENPELEPRMRLTSCHPGQSIEQIQKRTGFALEIAPDVTETPEPTKEEIYLLRNEIDPWGIRKLELLGGAERRSLLREIIKRETELLAIQDG